MADPTKPPDTTGVEAIVLLSGGLDSTITLFHAVEKFGNDGVAALFIEYGQRHWIEAAASRRVASIARVRLLHERIGARGIGLNCSLTQGDSEFDPGDVVVPMRNLLLLGLAGSVAMSVGASRVFVGFSGDDRDDFPDTTPEFVSAASSALSVSAGRRIDVAAPLIDRTKCQTVQEARRLSHALGGVPWRAIGRSWSCYDPQRISDTCGEWLPCKHCPACTKRRRGFEQAGDVDPAMSLPMRA